jgi:hypothetical protein
MEGEGRKREESKGRGGLRRRMEGEGGKEKNGR